MCVQLPAAPQVHEGVFNYEIKGLKPQFKLYKELIRINLLLYIIKLLE